MLKVHENPKVWPLILGHTWTNFWCAFFTS